MPQLRLILGVLLWEMASALTVFDVWTYYTGVSCRDVPKVIHAGNFTTCRDGCEHHSGDWTMENEECQITDYNAIMAREFTNTSYIVQESLDVDCESVLDVYAYIATGTCELAIMYVEDWGFRTYRIAQWEEGNGSLSARYFSDSKCLESLNETQLAIIAPTKDTIVDQALVGSNSCDENNFRWNFYDSANPYVPASSSSSSATGTTSSAIGDSSGADLSESVSASSSNSGVIIAGIAGAVVVVLVVLVLVYRKQRSKRKNFNRDDNLAVLGDSAGSGKRTSSTKGDSNSLEGAALGQSGLWNDDIITAKRIARREIQVKNLISRGAFGEVYEGVFNDKTVAVKMLSPEIRGGIRYVNNFLAEAKLTASMEHPHVVHFIGVAWDTLSDLCVVMEFMDGGDLRSLLSEYEQSGHPVGIDREKATIALHVCHALTYLHSLAPPIIHRDLKSRNILLTRDLKAKVTDFGISREKLDQTMTAGVGTSLWMAPEVMLGERYDDKADIFSFGVVLSELDLHTLPYAQAKDKNRDSNGHRLPDALLLQRVAMGKLRVEFSEASPRSLVELGVACVSVDPRLRPTAAEALYKLQKALTQELK